MSHSLFLLLPAVLAASRSLVFGIQSPSGSGVRQSISAEAEYQALVIVVFCLTGLLVTLTFMIRFPGLGAIIAEYNQI
jgi:hypothetical protein